MKRVNLNKGCCAHHCSIDRGGIISAFLNRCLKVTKEFEFLKSSDSLFHRTEKLAKLTGYNYKTTVNVKRQTSATYHQNEQLSTSKIKFYRLLPIRTVYPLSLTHLHKCSPLRTLKSRTSSKCGFSPDFTFVFCLIFLAGSNSIRTCV